jgi:hypothetical protein
VDELADSKDAADYRNRVSQHETLQLWQSIAFKPQYRSGYCVAVCPAGEDVVGPFLSDRKEHVRDVVRPLQQKPEPVYVTRGSSAERHVKKRFPNKTVRYVNATLEPPLEIDPTPRPQGAARRPPSNGGPPESDED